MPDVTYIPEIESGLALEKDVSDSDQLTPKQELEMRIRTIKLLADLSGEPIIPTKKNVKQATDLAKAMLEDPKVRPQFSKYPNETLAFLAGMVARMNVMIVDDLAEMKTYCLNKLVHEAETAVSSKDRIAALKLIGEVDGVDAFKKRSEVTHVIKPIEEVEKELREILEGVEYKVLESEKS